MKYNDDDQRSEEESIFFEDVEEENEYQPQRWKRKLLSLTALVILIAFIIWSFPQLGVIFSDLSFLAQNKQLKEEDIVKQSIPAIVSVEAKGEEGKNKNGTGFNITETGLIVTNYHVVQNADSIKVIFPDGKSFYSNDVKQISNADIVLISLNSQDLPCLPLELQKISDDELLFTIIGNPLGYKQIAVRGNIGSYYKYNDYIIFEIQAPVKKGSSGSPVINSQGRAVGIVFAHRDTANEEEIEYSALAIPLYQFASEIAVLMDEE
ncbi:MAG TPA: serine protease [Syntrophomonadaceae bacterium]|jgi:S1-C subfamily serine protease|nr:serine protease [Syntrophomonadaceae bacterium]HRX21086.1 serine protease [Syntrophomonadaceae bacterium]